MLKVRRADIQHIEDAIAGAVLSSTTMGDKQIRHPEIPATALAAAAMLAIQSVTMALYGPNDIACPSDVHHIIKET